MMMKISLTKWIFLTIFVVLPGKVPLLSDNTCFTSVSAVTTFSDDDDNDDIRILSSSSSLLLNTTMSVTIGESTHDIRLQSEDLSSTKGFWEVSGIALSPNQKAPSGEPVLYTVNDRGGSQRNTKIRLGIYDSGTGERLLTLRLTSLPSSPYDVESMTIGPCSNTDGINTPSSLSCIYIGDIGDNKARRTRGTESGRRNGLYSIYQIVEPIWQDYNDNNEFLSNGQQKVLNFDYGHESSPKRYADAEALFLDHSSSSSPDLYLVTKWNRSERRSLTRLYKFSSSEAWSSSNTVYSPVSYAYNDGVGIFNSKTWTSGEMSWDGNLIALGGVRGTHLFVRCPTMSIVDALLSNNQKNGNYCLDNDLSTSLSWNNYRISNADQHETIAFAPPITIASSENFRTTTRKEEIVISRALQISECTTSNKQCDPPMVWTDLEVNNIIFHQNNTNYHSEGEKKELSLPLLNIPSIIHFIFHQNDTNYHSEGDQKEPSQSPSNIPSIIHSKVPGLSPSKSPRNIFPSKFPTYYSVPRNSIVPTTGVAAAKSSVVTTAATATVDTTEEEEEEEEEEELHDDLSTYFYIPTIVKDEEYGPIQKVNCYWLQRQVEKVYNLCQSEYKIYNICAKTCAKCTNSWIEEPYHHNNYDAKKEEKNIVIVSAVTPPIHITTALSPSITMTNAAAAATTNTATTKPTIEEEKTRIIQLDSFPSKIPALSPTKARSLPTFSPNSMSISPQVFPYQS